MLLSDYDFELPEGAVARYPAERRDASRLLIVDRLRRTFHDTVFSQLPGLLTPGDLLVVNDTRVLAGRLKTVKAETGGKVELLLVEPRDDSGSLWRAMARGAKSLRIGARLAIEPDRDPDVIIEVVERHLDGFVDVRLPLPAEELSDRFGALPLPPYMGREADSSDHDRYQTIFAGAERRSVAAPTAGLHFTTELRVEAEARGIEFCAVTLHVGPGTFLPVRTDDVRDHVMHSERFSVSKATAERINATRAAGGRVIAVGTTVTRVLETIKAPLEAQEGSTQLFVKPGFEFSVIDGLVTNFHLPRSTLLMLVSAFADRELILDAYAAAIQRGYRFYSYGDAMLIL